MSESKLQADIITALCLDTRVAWVMAVTTGTFKVKGGYTTVGTYSMEDMKRRTGMADIVGQLTTGQSLAIEVKLSGETPSKEQTEFLALVGRNNGVSGWATSIHEAYEILDSANIRRI